MAKKDDASKNTDPKGDGGKIGKEAWDRFDKAMDKVLGTGTGKPSPRPSK